MNDFLQYEDWHNVNTEHATGDSAEYGVAIQWNNGKPFYPAPQGQAPQPTPSSVSFGGFQIIAESFHRFGGYGCDIGLDFAPVPHGSNLVESYMSPNLSFSVVTDIYLYQVQTPNGHYYSRSKSSGGKGKLLLYGYCREFESCLPNYTPIILSLKGSAMAQYFTLKNQFLGEVVATGASIIGEHTNQPPPQLPLYMFWLPLATSGQETRMSASNETYTLAPIVQGWDSAISESTLQNIHPDMSTLRISPEMLQFINDSGWEAGQKWKAEKEEELLSKQPEAQPQTQQWNQAPAQPPMTAQQYQAMTHGRDFDPMQYNNMQAMQAQYPPQAQAPQTQSWPAQPGQVMPQGYQQAPVNQSPVNQAQKWAAMQSGNRQPQAPQPQAQNWQSPPPPQTPPPVNTTHEEEDEIPF